MSNGTRWAWFFGGWMFGGVAAVCFAAKLFPFSIGAVIVSACMFLESAIGKADDE